MDLSSEEMEARAMAALIAEQQGMEVLKMVDYRAENSYQVAAICKEGSCIRLCAAFVTKWGNVIKEGVTIGESVLLDLITAEKKTAL